MGIKSIFNRAVRSLVGFFGGSLAAAVPEREAVPARMTHRAYVSKSRKRSRIPGPPGVAGDKLARMAAEGRLGVARGSRG